MSRRTLFAVPPQPVCGWFGKLQPDFMLRRSNAPEAWLGRRLRPPLCPLGATADYGLCPLNPPYGGSGGGRPALGATVENTRILANQRHHVKMNLL